MPQKCMECFRLLFDHLAWIEYQFLSGIRDSRKTGSLWGMMRGVGGVRKSEHQSWLAKGLGLGLGLLFWGFKAVQEEIQGLSLWDNCGDERGCDEDHWHAHTRGLLWSLPEVVGTIQVHCSRTRLLRRGLEFHMCTINKSTHTKNVWKLI